MPRFLYGAFLAALATASHAGVAVVPEVDGSGAIAAIALLAGVVALVVERRK